MVPVITIELLLKTAAVLIFLFGGEAQEKVVQSCL